MQGCNWVQTVCVLAGRNEKGSSPRGSGGGEAPPFPDFSSFHEIIREERKVARAEREAAAAEARVEREMAAADQRRLMADLFELKLQLAQERGRRLGVSRGELWAAGSRGEHRGPIEIAVQSGAAAGDDRITNPGEIMIRLHGKHHVGSMGIESAPSPSRSQASRSRTNGDKGTVPVQRENNKNQRNRSNMSPCLMVRRPSFQLKNRILPASPSFMAAHLLNDNT